jgi:hypothetical protein
MDASVRARTKPDEVAAQYLGDRACARCHAREFKTHTASNHALTLRPMRRQRLPEAFPAAAQFADPDRNVEYAMREVDGRFMLSARAPGGDQERAVDLALGSGKRAMTFVSLDAPGSILELRLSYFPRRHQWFVTPGQAGSEADVLGARHAGRSAQRCLACHATVLPESRTVPEERFMGIGCEACHGPGRAHVAAAEAGGKPAQIERMRDWKATRVNELCGECHRTKRDINADDGVSMYQTQRFQPYGLMKSRCFLASDDQLSCVTCHNPHRNVEKRTAPYERACLSCHGRKPEQTRCPVNSRAGCVGCHMPQREFIPGISMADHFIRVFRGTAPMGRPSR